MSQDRAVAAVWVCKRLVERLLASQDKNVLHGAGESFHYDIQTSALN